VEVAVKEHAKHRRVLYTALLYSLGALFGAAAVAPVSLGAQDAAKLSITVTVLGRGKKEAPALARQDVMVFQDRERRPVLDWTPVQANQANLDLAILMDDSLDSNIGVQFRDIANFIRSLPPATRVSVVYGTHGNANVRQRFTSDHHLAAKALRLPVGRSNESSSI
jgi:hypothetical protein